jgi:drug/metabolite transporter (DMT)-like permease
VAVLLGVFVALSFGTGDFLGGRATRKASAVGTLVISQACGFAAAAVLALATAATVAAHDIVLGMCAGAVSVVGLGLLYRALAQHAVGVVAPIAAVVGSLVPVTWGLLQGERPSALACCGIVLAISAGALISRDQSEVAGGWAAGGPIAAVAGFALGLSLVFFSETAPDSGMWPVLAARGTAAILVWLFAIALLVRHHPLPVPHGRMIGVAAVAGLLDVAGSALLLLAIRHGLIVIVAPLAALSPGFTVVLAWAVLGEHLGRVQRIGLVCALVGLVLVSIG